EGERDGSFLWHEGRRHRREEVFHIGGGASWANPRNRRWAGAEEIDIVGEELDDGRRLAFSKPLKELIDGIPGAHVHRVLWYIPWHLRTQEPFRSVMLFSGQLAGEPVRFPTGPAPGQRTR